MVGKGTATNHEAAIHQWQYGDLGMDPTDPQCINCIVSPKLCSLCTSPVLTLIGGVRPVSDMCALVSLDLAVRGLDLVKCNPLTK